MATHLAAFSLAKGEPLTVQSRPTPKPGLGELLVEVKSVALNPADYYMRDRGLFIPGYPTVTGFDIAGLVLEVGENVPIHATDESWGLFFQPGITRIAAYAASFWRSCDPNYGAFQERCLVPWQHALPVLDDKISWNQAATLPVSVSVPLNAWDLMGVPRVGEFLASARAQKDKALLIWGASSSVGTMGVQSARLLRDDPKSSFAAVYATAGAANQEYVESLGASRVFDYKDPQVVDAIVSAAKEDGLVIEHCFLATGKLASCQAVLKAFIDDRGESQRANIVSAQAIPSDAQKVDGVETTFLMPSGDEVARLAQFRYWMGTWLKDNLANGTIRPSPEPRVVGKGVGAINSGLDLLIKGVSCTKLVIEIAE
jgi:NADPH:quinone reductase-like Zn-dependent oxidoreductase